MSFEVIEGDVVIRDTAGNPVALVLDGSIYRIRTEAKIANSGGTVIDPATEATLAARATEATLATRATEATLATRASQTTLAAVDAKLATIDSVLDSIKDLDGVKKIDKTVSVVIGGVPSSPSAIVSSRLVTGASSPDLIVDGSSTAVDFEYAPTGSDVVGLYELRLFLAADNINFDAASFGAIAALANGLRISVVINSVETVIGTLTTNEDFGLIGSPASVFYQNTGPGDSIGLAVPLAGIVLDAATSDLVRVRVQDNLVNVKHKFFQTQIVGVVQ